MRRVLNEIVRRHEILRTSFAAENGLPVQIINPVSPLALPKVDLSAVQKSERELKIHQLIHEESRLPFDLTQSSLLRFKLIRLDDDEHIALFTMHHIVSDGWSMGVLIGEVSALYEAFCEGKPSPLPELEIQYADFASWQKEWLQGEVLREQLSYWARQLEGRPEGLDLPIDKPRPAIQSYRGARQSFALSGVTAKQLRHLAEREGVTNFMILLAAFKALLYHYSGQEDILIGTPIAGRTRAETEKLIGFFANMLALRTTLSGNPTFRELLLRVREVTLGAYMRQDLPFEKLVEELHPEREFNRQPLIQAVFALQNAPMQALKLGDLTLNSLGLEPGTAKFDLVFNLWEAEQGFTGALEYSTDLFEAATIAHMLNHYERLLVGAINDPEIRLDMMEALTDEEGSFLDRAIEIEGLDESFSFS
jgi:non-ribosomal peptide synthetase component F